MQQAIKPKKRNDEACDNESRKQLSMQGRT